MATTTKIFDILIRSKHTPEGVQGILKGLKSIGEAGTFIRFGLIQPLQQAGEMVLSFIAKANPERIQALQGAFDNLQTSIGRLLDRALGPAIDELGRLVNNATLLSNIGANLDPIYTGIIQHAKEAGLSAEELRQQLQGASDAAVEAARREKEANPFLFIGVNAEDAAVRVDKLREALLNQSRTMQEYIAALAAAGIEIKSISAEIQRFLAIKNIQPPTFDINALVKSAKELSARENQARFEGLIQQSRLIEDIARAQARRRQDIARQNVRQLNQIEAQYTQAIAQAEQARTDSIAQINADAARQRLEIEQNYQDAVRRINETSGDSIEDAIERRDARALSKALRDRGRQLNEAARARDQQLAAADQQAGEQRAQAQQQAADTRAQAEQARAQQLADLKAANAQQESENKIAIDRQLEDFRIGQQRRMADLKIKNAEEIAEAQKKYAAQLTAYRNYLNEIQSITMGWAQGTAFANTIQNAVNQALGNLFGIELKPTVRSSR